MYSAKSASSSASTRLRVRSSSVAAMRRMLSRRSALSRFNIASRPSRSWRATASSWHDPARALERGAVDRSSREPFRSQGLDSQSRRTRGDERSFVGHDGRAAETGGDDDPVRGRMECVREQPAGQRLPAGAQLLVNAAAIVVRQESAGAIGALANPMQRRQAGNRLERIHLRPSGFGGQVAIRAAARRPTRGTTVRRCAAGKARSPPARRRRRSDDSSGRTASRRSVDRDRCVVEFPPT